VPNAPAGVKSVSVPVFQNLTTEPQVDSLCTQALREHYQRAGALAGDGAEGSVQGVVTAVNSNALLAAPERGAFPTYRISGTVQLKLMKGEVLVREVVVSGMEDYPSGADLLITESNRATALRRLCDVLMRDGAEQLAGFPSP
jgi:hypothetical protein